MTLMYTYMEILFFLLFIYSELLLNYLVFSTTGMDVVKYLWWFSQYNRNTTLIYISNYSASCCLPTKDHHQAFE